MLVAFIPFFITLAIIAVGMAFTHKKDYKARISAERLNRATFTLEEKVASREWMA